MKKNMTISASRDYTADLPKRHAQYADFSKKDTIIRSLEIIVACIIAFVAGVGVYGYLS